MPLAFCILIFSKKSNRTQAVKFLKLWEVGESIPALPTPQEVLLPTELGVERIFGNWSDRTKFCHHFNFKYRLILNL